jgi:hypothetical protein
MKLGHVLHKILFTTLRAKRLGVECVASLSLVARTTQQAFRNFVTHLIQNFAYLVKSHVVSVSEQFPHNLLNTVEHLYKSLIYIEAFTHSKEVKCSTKKR